MASSIAPTTPPFSASAKINPNSTSLSHSNLSLPLFSPNPTFPLSTKGLQSSWNRSVVVKAKLNEVRGFQWFSFEELLSSFHTFVNNILEPFVALKVADESSSAAVTSSSKADLSAAEVKDTKPSSVPGPVSLTPEESISQFIAQARNLVKLVDSRDIVELQLKQHDCEILIRKMEALPQPPASPPVMMHAPPAPATLQTASPHAPSAPPRPVAPATAVSPPAPKSAKSSHPPLKCPMAGTFYRSPAPGEPAFVKVGDKVQKGQVLCIIEAMKLMNEIEADNSGTITEILVDDGKPVSVDMPLFVIEP